MTKSKLLISTLALGSLSLATGFAKAADTNAQIKDLTKRINTIYGRLNNIDEKLDRLNQMDKWLENQAAQVRETRSQLERLEAYIVNLERTQTGESAVPLEAQPSTVGTEDKRRIAALEREVQELKEMVQRLQPMAQPYTPISAPEAFTKPVPQPEATYEEPFDPESLFGSATPLPTPYPAKEKLEMPAERPSGRPSVPSSSRLLKGKERQEGRLRRRIPRLPTFADPGTWPEPPNPEPQKVEGWVNKLTKLARASTEEGARILIDPIRQMRRELNEDDAGSVRLIVELNLDNYPTPLRNFRTALNEAKRIG